MFSMYIVKARDIYLFYSLKRIYCKGSITVGGGARQRYTNRVGEREREIDRDWLIFHPLIYSLNCHKNQIGQVKNQKPETAVGFPIWVAGAQLFEWSSPGFSRYTLRELDRSRALGLKLALIWDAKIIGGTWFVPQCWPSETNIHPVSYVGPCHEYSHHLWVQYFIFLQNDPGAQRSNL